MVKFTRIISKEGEKNKCYIKHKYWKVFKYSIKLLTSLYLAMLQPFFTQRALKEKLGTPREIGNTKKVPRALQGWSKITWRALEGHLGTRALEGQLCTQALKTLDTWGLELLRNSGTRRALGHIWPLGTWTLGHLGTQALRQLCNRGTLFSRLS